MIHVLHALATGIQQTMSMFVYNLLFVFVIDLVTGDKEPISTRLLIVAVVWSSLFGLSKFLLAL